MPPLQFVLAAVVQAPLPLQTDAGMNEKFPLHVAGVHTVLPPGYVQAAAFVPLQWPAQVACDPLQAGREPRGAPLTVMQVPTLFGSLHAWH